MALAQLSYVSDANPAAAGPAINQGGGRDFDAFVSELHAKYYHLAARGLLFNACNQAAQAVSVALATAYTGLCISNPIGNNKNIVLLGAGYALSVAQVAIASLHLINGASATANPTHTVPLVAPGIQNNLLQPNAPLSSMKADSSATISTPNYLLPMMGGFTAGAFGASPMVYQDLGGQFIIGPGGFIAWGALTAVTGFGGFVWAELPLQ